MTTLLLLFLIVFTLVTTYLFWIRPILKTKPSLMTYYAQERSIWSALYLKFDGFKQKLTTAIVGMAAFVVSTYDFLAPLFVQSGIDVTTISSHVPQKAWPIISFALIALVQYFRNLADKKE